jgi:hypothetical protein
MIVANEDVAIFAMENMLSKFQVLKRSTVGAFARGSFPAVNFDNGLSVLEGNPFQNVHEAVKAQVGNFATPKSFHAVGIQIFRAHDPRTSRLRTVRWIAFCLKNPTSILTD